MTRFLLSLSFFTLLACVAISGPDKAGFTKSKSFAVSKGGTLEVSINGGDVRISTWEKNEVSVKVHLFDEDEESVVRMTQSSNLVRISDQDDWGDGGDRLYEVSVPSQFNIEVATNMGEISVKGKLTGQITCKTSAGDVKTGDVDGMVDLSTSGGDVRAGKINGDGNLNTSGGEIDVAGVTGEFNVHTSGGNIRIGNVGKSLRASTSGGDVLIGDVGGEATVSTSGGNIVMGKVLGRVAAKTSGGDIELRGGSGSIRAVTSGGNLNLENLTGSVEAKTAGGDIQAELIPSGKGQSRLASASGTIRLYLPETAKATIEARIRTHEGRWWGKRKNKDEEYHIWSDFPSQAKSQRDEDQTIESTYMLNGGGELITLETVNSDIEIRKMLKSDNK